MDGKNWLVIRCSRKNINKSGEMREKRREREERGERKREKEKERGKKK